MISFFGKDGSGVRVVEALDFHARDPAAFHFHNGETIAVVLKYFTAAGKKTQVGKDEAGERFVSRVFEQLDVELAFEVPDIQRSVENHGAVGEVQRMLDDVELVVNFANHLLEDVLESDQAEDGAEFVDSHGEAGASRAKFKQKLDGGFRLGNDEDAAKNVAKVKFGGRLILFGATRAIQ